MSNKAKDSFQHFTWRRYLKPGLRKRQPAAVTVQWLEENRWWWRRVPEAIQRNAEDMKPHHDRERDMFIAGLTHTWRSVQLSAFLHELGRRCQNKKTASWLELPDKELMRLLRLWPDKHSTASHDTPLIRQPFREGMGWHLEPVKPCRCRKTGEALWNKNEPAWTEPYIVTANLNIGDKTILNQFKEWLAEERTRTGIYFRKHGSTQRFGKHLWRFIEVLDKRAAGIKLDETGHSNCAKAEKLWQAVANISSPYSPEFYLRVVLRDIPKHGKILPSSLPSVSSAPR